MKSPMAAAAAALLLAACGGTRPEPAAPATPPEGLPPAAETKAPASESPAPASPAPEPGAPEAEPAHGRMAFVQCDPEHRPEMCTKEYRPVCGEVDNGIRCVTTPCPSTDKKNFGNACTACADPKTTGHWPVRCEDLGNDVGGQR